MRLRGVWTTNLTGLLIGFGMFGSFILIPQFVQTPEAAGFGFGADVTGAGLFMGPSAVIMLVAGPLAGALAGRVGSKVPLLMGAVCAGTSFFLLSVAHSQEWQVVAAVTLLGLGIGLSFASMANLIVEAVPQHQTGEATGMNTIMRTVGGAFGGQMPRRSWPITWWPARASRLSPASRRRSRWAPSPWRWRSWSGR
jgi:MFS family permease